MSTTIRTFALALATLALLPAVVLAAPDPDELLKKMDDVTSGYADQEMDVDLVIGDVDGSKKIYGMTVWQQGEKRLVRFTSGETKGLATLIDGDRMYVFMPGFKKTISWAADYDVVFEKETDTQYVLRGKPKAGKNIEYASVLLYLAKDGYYQDAVDYFNEKGKVNQGLTEDNFTKRQLQWGGK